MITRLFGCVAMLTGAIALAHPLGNNTINRQSTITVAPQAVELRYLFDVAEIPTLLAAQEADRDQDGATTADEWRAYAERWAAAARTQLRLALDGAAVDLKALSATWALASGDAGLETLRLEGRYSATMPGPRERARIEFHDTYQPARAGWKEIRVTAAAGVEIVASSTPQADRSRTLTDFTLPLAAQPLNELSAHAEVRLTGTPLAQSSATMPPEPAPAQPSLSSTRQAWAFFTLGMHHIAFGWDHLLFLLGLLLLRLELRRIIFVVTAFTVAHSLTLGLAAAGGVTPPSIWIEPTIALTIAWVGLMILFKRGDRHGAALAFGFGLIHGFGFAGALAESALLAGREGNAFLLSLASFNLGIEALQVLLVLAVAPLLALSARRAWFAFAERAAAAGLAGVGLGVFALRLGGAL